MGYYSDIGIVNGCQGYVKEAHGFKSAYNFWKENLFERMCRLFVWENTHEVNPRHIETTLLLNGSVGILNHNGLKAFYGTYNGIGDYYDEFPNYMVRSPKFTGNTVIGKDSIVIRNNKLGNNAGELIHRYAQMLAHTEVTLITTLINARSGGSVPTASTSKQKTILENYRNNLCNGKVLPIQDPAFVGVEWSDTHDKVLIPVQELMEVRQNLLNSFYNDIGVRTTWNKKGNMISDEVGGNDSMLLLNIEDMLEERKKGCELVNSLFGTNWSVDKSEELKYERSCDNDTE